MTEVLLIKGCRIAAACGLLSTTSGLPIFDHPLECAHRDLTVDRPATAVRSFVRRRLGARTPDLCSTIAD